MTTSKNLSREGPRIMTARPRKGKFAAKCADVRSTVKDTNS